MEQAMSLRFIVAFALLPLFCGCSIHPLPDDVSGVSTPTIVRQIRCEARDTIRKRVIQWLSGLNDPLPKKLAMQYENDPASIRNFHYDLFKTPALVRVRSVAKLFYDTGIAYNFDITITEDNNLSTDVSFLKPLTNPKFTLGFNAGANRRRANERIFTTTDTFSYLLTKLREDYCNGHIVEANYIYPITGRIGVDKIVNDFIELTLFEGLAGKDDKQQGPPTMADTLTYTTAITASATPKIEFAPVNQAFQLASASLNGTADRTDIHKVIVALAISPGSITELDPVRRGLLAPSQGSLVVGRRVTGGGTSSEQLAVRAIDQIKSREFQIVPVQ
jgi:hypothetical protein